MNDEPHVTNFYSKANVDIRRQACQGKRQCMDKAPLYALMGMFGANFVLQLRIRTNIFINADKVVENLKVQIAMHVIGVGATPTENQNIFTTGNVCNFGLEYCTYKFADILSSCE